MNRQVLLKRRPVGMPVVDDFEIVEAPLQPLTDGQVRRKTLYLSLDPYMRGRMSDRPSYAPPVAVGGVMVGGTVSEVVESRNPAFAPGDLVVGNDGWQTHHLSAGQDIRAIDASGVRASAYLGVLGMPGLTAYVGLLDIGQAKSGETVVVSAAAGAVGSLVGQLAKVRGCRAVGVAGGPDKCAHVVNDLGFDACVDYKAPGFFTDLKAACPDGIDVYFDNVAGDVLKAVLRLLRRGARIPLCGLISEYNSTEPVAGPNLLPLLVNRAQIKGFLVFDHFDRLPAFLGEVAPLVLSGRIRFREQVVDGLDAAPGGLIALLEGRNTGKMLVRVAEGTAPGS